MKFEEFYIEIDQKNENTIVDTLESIGFSKKENYDNGSKFISTYKSGKFRKVNRNFFSHQPLYTFEQFMQKYGSNTMIEKINQAKKQLNFNNKQLSESLGYSRQYITKMLNLPQSEKIQDKVCKEIDVLLDREKIKKTIASNSIQTRVEDIENPINEMSVLLFQNNCKDKDITALKKKLENNQVVINKLDDQLIRAEKVHNEDVKALQEAHSIIHNLNSEIKANRMHIQTLQSNLKFSKEESEKMKSGLVEWRDECVLLKDRIVCERWLFLIIIAILSAVVIFK